MEVDQPEAGGEEHTPGKVHHFNPFSIINTLSSVMTYGRINS